MRANALEYSVTDLCRAVKINPASYYRSLKKAESEPPVAKDAAQEAVRAIFKEHSRRYGARRIHAELKARGLKVGRHRVGRILRQSGLRAIQPRSFVPRTTDSKHTLGYSPNLLLRRQLPPREVRTVLVSDITYLPMQAGGFSYLVTWMDLFSRRILGWAVGAQMNEDLLLSATGMMFKQYKLAHNAIVHSDRGGQYAGRRYRNLLKQNRCRQSMSRAGETWDNAFAESLFSRYKAELLENGAFASLEEAIVETFNYFEVYYNRIRRHSGLSYRSPAEYEKSRAAQRDVATKRKLDKEKKKGIKV